MRIDKEVVEHVADLARLNLSEEEVKEFLPQLREVLESFSKIDEVDVKDAKPSFQPIELKNAMREDEATKCLSQEEALRNSPNTKDGYFKGPRAI